MGRQWQLLAELPGDGGVDPLPVGRLDGLLLVGGPADGDLPVAGAVAAVAPERGDQFGVGGGADESVADASGQLRRHGPRRRHHDRRRLLRHRVEPGGVDRPVVINRRIVERREIAAIDSAGGKQQARLELLHTDAEGLHDFSLKRFTIKRNVQLIDAYPFYGGQRRCLRPRRRL